MPSGACTRANDRRIDVVRAGHSRGRADAGAPAGIAAPLPGRTDADSTCDRARVRGSRADGRADACADLALPARASDHAPRANDARLGRRPAAITRLLAGAAGIGGHAAVGPWRLDARRAIASRAARSDMGVATRFVSTARITAEASGRAAVGRVVRQGRRVWHVVASVANGEIHRHIALRLRLLLRVPDRPGRAVGSVYELVEWKEHLATRERRYASERPESEPRTGHARIVVHVSCPCLRFASARKTEPNSVRLGRCGYPRYQWVRSWRRC